MDYQDDYFEAPKHGADKYKKMLEYKLEMLNREGLMTEGHNTNCIKKIQHMLDDIEYILDDIDKKQRILILKEPCADKNSRNTRETTKTSQAGTKAGETRATFIMNEDQLESVKAIAYWDIVSINDVLYKAIDDYLFTQRHDLFKALASYKGRVKE